MLDPLATPIAAPSKPEPSVVAAPAPVEAEPGRADAVNTMLGQLGLSKNAVEAALPAADDDEARPLDLSTVESKPVARPTETISTDAEAAPSGEGDEPASDDFFALLDAETAALSASVDAPAPPASDVAALQQQVADLRTLLLAVAQGKIAPRPEAAPVPTPDVLDLIPDDVISELALSPEAASKLNSAFGKPLTELATQVHQLQAQLSYEQNKQAAVNQYTAFRARPDRPLLSFGTAEQRQATHNAFCAALDKVQTEHPELQGPEHFVKAMEAAYAQTIRDLQAFKSVIESSKAGRNGGGANLSVPMPRAGAVAQEVRGQKGGSDHLDVLVGMAKSLGLSTTKSDLLNLSRVTK